MAALMAVRGTNRAPRPLAARLRSGAFQVALSGDIDLMSSRRRILIAEDFLQSDHACADVDPRKVTCIDSTGVPLLVRLHRTAVARAGKVTLLEPSGICLRMLERLCYGQIFEIRRAAIPHGRRPDLRHRSDLRACRLGAPPSPPQLQRKRA